MKKALTGVEFFDQAYGGIYLGRPMMLAGHRGSGKTMFCLQFLKQGLALQEPVLMLSAKPSAETAAACENMGIDADRETERNRLFIMNYGDLIGSNQREQDIMLPPEGFMELKDIIERKGIQRVALDTVLPWMNLTAKGHLAEHVFSFVRSFERMKATAVFTLFKPASPAAKKLYSLIEEAVPVSVMIDYDPAAGIRRWNVEKYYDTQSGLLSRRIIIDPKIGIVPLQEIGEDWQVDYREPDNSYGSEDEQVIEVARSPWDMQDEPPTGQRPEDEPSSPFAFRHDDDEKLLPEDQAKENKRENGERNNSGQDDISTLFARAVFAELEDDDSVS